MAFQYLEDSENAKVQQLIKKFTNTSLTDIKIDDLYPEYDLNGLYGLKSDGLSMEQSFYAFEKLIVKVYPSSSKQEFELSNGLRFNDFIALIEEKKILPMVCYPYQNYPSFYNDLFSKSKTHFPRTGRIRDLLHQRMGIQMKILEKKVKKICKDNEHRCQVIVEEYFKNYSKQNTKLVAESFISDLIDLLLLNMDNTVEIILDIAEKIDIVIGFRFARGYAKLLARPLFENLQGINSFTDSDLKLAGELYLKNQEFRNFIGQVEYDRIANKVELHMGINPGRYTKLSNDTFDLKIQSTSIENKLNLITELSNRDETQELKKYLTKIKSKHFSDFNIIELQKIAREINTFIERDAKRLKLYNQACEFKIHYGTILEDAIKNEAIHGTDLTSLSLSTISSFGIELLKGYANEKEDWEKVISEVKTIKFGNDFFKPIATYYWQAQNSKKKK